jgi:hypothetical protein
MARGQKNKCLTMHTQSSTRHRKTCPYSDENVDPATSQCALGGLQTHLKPHLKPCKLAIPDGENEDYDTDAAHTLLSLQNAIDAVPSLPLANLQFHHAPAQAPALSNNTDDEDIYATEEDNQREGT